ncbi:MAG TPA: HlyD family secretion protein [Candidatus Acidoferrales bacterium]|jgi:membrane fusion protein (multidrug efflux system)|nr:HlyD family secretion protein [Candidatus Acidoferrales bacterium]
MSSPNSTPPPQPPVAPGPSDAPATPATAAAPALDAPPQSESWWEKIKKLDTFTKSAIVVVLVAIGIVWYVYSGRVTTDDAQVDCHITAMAPQVPGYVVQLYINDNTDVKQGDLLVQIDPRPYQAEVDQAQANLDVAEAQANSAKLQIGLTRAVTTQSTSGATAQQESDAATYASSQAQLEQSATANLQVAEADVAAKRATNDRAQSDLGRYTPLLATDDVSKFQFDAVDAAARVAKSELEAAQQQLTAAKEAVEIARANARSAQARVLRSQSQLLETKAREQQVPITEADYKSALATVERAKATLQQAQLNLGYTHIVAPISGQVTQKVVDLGQYVSPGELLFTIVPLNQVYVTANFKETQLDGVEPGQRARLHVDTYRQDFDGVVDSIAGAAGSRQALLPPQNATGNFIKVVQRIPVKILVKPSKNSNFVLRPGMNVEATIYTR